MLLIVISFLFAWNNTAEAKVELIDFYFDGVGLNEDDPFKGGH